MKINYLKKLLTGTLFCFALLSSCTFDMTTETTFHEDRTMDMVMTIDFEKAMNSPNKDMVLNIVNGAIKNAMKSQNDSSKRKVDLSFIQTEGIDTFLKLDMALDTMNLFNMDSIHQAFKKANKIDLFTVKDMDFLGNLISKLINNTKIHVYMYPAKNIMYASFEIRAIAYDDFLTDEFQGIYKKLMADSAFASIKNKKTLSSLIWKKNKISWDGFDKKNNPLKKGEGEEKQNEVLQQTLTNSGIIMIYHFPKEILKNKNSNYTISDDGKTITYKGLIKDMFEGKVDVSNMVKYAK